MAENVVLDSSALLAFLFGESSADDVEEFLAGSLEGNRRVMVSAINWAEVLCRVIEARGNEGLSILQHIERTSPIEIISVDAALAETAGVISTQYSLPLADAFAAALAKRHQALVVTGDGDFKVLEREVKIHWLRPRPEKAPASASPVVVPPQPTPVVHSEPIAASVPTEVKPPVAVPRQGEGKNDRSRNRPDRRGRRPDRRGKNQPQANQSPPQPVVGYQKSATQGGKDRRHHQQGRRHGAKGRPVQQPRQAPVMLSTPRKRVRPDGTTSSDHFQHVRPKAVAQAKPQSSPSSQPPQAAAGKPKARAKGKSKK